MTWYFLPGFKITAFIPTWHHFDLSMKFYNPEARFQSKTGRGTVVIMCRKMMEVISTVLGVEGNRKKEETVSGFKLNKKGDWTNETEGTVH